MLDKYIERYKECIKEFDFQPQPPVRLSVLGIDISVYPESGRKGDYCGGEKASVVMEKGALRYTCELWERHNDQCFYPITLEGKTYLCFRKTLYGFTLLDTDTLLEAYDFFPEEVLWGDESFIICGAQSLGDLILFDGCYWACPYSYIVYDHKTRRFYDLYDAYHLQCGDGDGRVEGDTFCFSGRDQEDKKVEVCVTKEELYRFLAEKGTEKF